MVDRLGRDRLAALIIGVQRGVIEFDAIESSAEPKSVDRAMSDLPVELQEIATLRLPMSPKEVNDVMPPDVIETLDRVVLFLQSDLEYDPYREGPVEYYVNRVLFAGFIIGIIALITGVVLKSMGLEQHSKTLFMVFACSIGPYVAALALNYFIGLSLAFKHIFCVRVLRRDMSNENESVWPFPSKETLTTEKARSDKSRAAALTPPATSPS